MIGDPVFTGPIWILVLILGLGTFSLRLSFIQLHAWIDEFPPLIDRALTFLPPAILAALVGPELVVLDRSILGMVLDPHLIAGGLSVLVAWRTESMTATIVVGMGVLWVFTPILG